MSTVSSPPRSSSFVHRLRRPGQYTRISPSSWSDAAAIVGLVALAVAAEWDRLTGPTWIGMDTATAFFPWYTFLGEQLRAGHIPVWNPHQFSGAPFAGDPETGWMYLPAMFAFTLLPLDAAIRAHLLFHVLLAALSTYALARGLGSAVLGGLVAATIYSHSGFLEGHNVCCYAYSDVAAWLPLALLGVELAIRSPGWRVRVLWWGVSGLALSQILAAWIGQGAYYALLVLASFIIYRTVFRRVATARGKLTAVALNGAGVLVVGGALAAAGLLPRLEYNLVSNLPGGYPSADVSATAWSDWGLIAGWDRLLLQPGFEYIGWPAFILAVAAPFVARRQAAVAYFACLGVAVLVLARAEPTPLHAALSLLPGFERVHARSPERALIVLYLAPALLAGATVSAITIRRRWRIASNAVGLAALAVIALDLHGAWTEQSALSLAGGGDYQFQRVDLGAYFAPTPGAHFLTSAASASEPFRYVGYAGHVFGGPMPYTLRWTDPSIAALQVNNRALLTGLQDMAGYNPVHIARYDDYVAALNGQAQNYHHADVFESGINSPLLDLLNVRYIVLPAVPASDEVAPHIARSLTSVYEDDSVRILENPSALPRAWIVHVAVQVPPETSLKTLADPGFDARHIAILETSPGSFAPPDLSAAADPSAESVTVVGYAADRVQLRARATAPGLVVASEVYYPAWHAYLDGRPVPMYAVDRALRGVAVPPGDHVVEMRYESPALLAGLLVSGAAASILLALAILHIATRSRDGSGEVRCKTGAVPQL